MLTVDTPRELLEQWDLYFLEFGRIGDVQDFFDLVQEHDFLWRIDLGPVLEQSQHNFFREGWVFLKKLDDTVGQLRMVKRESLDFMKRDKDASQKRLVFLFERQCETIDDRAQNLQELCDSIVALGLIDEMVKDIAYRSADERAEIEKFAIYAVKRRLEEIALSWILGVKELEKTEHEWLIDVPFCEICVEIWTFDKTKEKLVDNLEMRPGEFEDRLIFLRIECVSGGVDGRGYRAKEVDSKLEGLSCGGVDKCPRDLPC